jgi:alkylation response protein AidB-like acyl-CoA dehydrogenase
MKLTSEQSELRDLIHRFFAEKITPEYLRSRVSSAGPVDAALQQELEALGLYEGFSGDSPAFAAQELGIVAEECGHFLVPEPLIEQLLASGLASQFIASADRLRLQPLTLPNTRGTIANPACCKLTVDPQTGTISGSVVWLMGASCSSWFLGFIDTPQGRRVCACSLTDAGITLTRKTALDLSTALHSLELREVPGIILEESSSIVIEDLLEAMKACEVAGICKRVIDMTVEYVKTRQQFGVAIGSFQAIQQKLADCYAKSEALASLARFATWSASHSPQQRHLTSRAAILEAVQTGPLVCEAAIQAHGGIGFTWEYDLHLYLRRAKAIQAAFALSEVRARSLIEAVTSV